MNIVDMLQLTSGGRALLDQGASLGLAKGDMVGLLGRLVTAIAAAVQSQCERQGAPLADVLEHLNGARLADAVEAQDSQDLARFSVQGQLALSQLLPADGAVQTLATRAAAASDLPAEPVQQLLPLVAGLFIGVLQQVETGRFKPKGGGMAAMAVSMAANMLLSSGAGAGGLLKFIDMDQARGLLDGLEP